VLRQAQHDAQDDVTGVSDPSLRQTGHHGALADFRSRRHRLPRDGAAGLLLHLRRRRISLWLREPVFAVRPRNPLPHHSCCSLWQGRVLGRPWYKTQIHSERSDPLRAESAVEECSEPTSQSTLFFFLNSAIPLPGAFSLFSSARVRTSA